MRREEVEAHIRMLREKAKERLGDTPKREDPPADADAERACIDAAPGVGVAVLHPVV